MKGVLRLQGEGFKVISAFVSYVIISCMPTTNIIRALVNLAAARNFNLPDGPQGANRITTVGAPLECFIRDAFCDSAQITDLREKETAHREHLSYLGNSKNPPDFVIRGGDAVEVKKIENPLSGIALNSSYPKDHIYANDPMLSAGCRDCEEGWQQKDLIYAIGVVSENTIQSLLFVFGDCYAANREVYERIKQRIVAGVAQTEEVEFADTNELARVNQVDPLGITYLRVRGMWGIENPRRVFADLNFNSREGRPLIATIMLRTKFDSFPTEDRRALAQAADRIEDIQIRNPNNPAQMLDAKLIVL